MNELCTSVGRLQTAVASSKKSARFSHLCGVSHPAQMAQTIWARYGQGTAAWQPLSPILPKNSTGQTAVTHQHQYFSQTQVKPRLNLVLIQNNLATNTTNFDSTGKTLNPNWQPKRPIHIGHLSMSMMRQHHLTKKTEAQQLTQTLYKKYQTRNTLTQQTASIPSQQFDSMNLDYKSVALPQPAHTTPPQAATRVLRRSYQTMALDSTIVNHKNAQIDKDDPFGLSRKRIGETVTTGSIPAIDTNQLADQVMQKLENRLHAHRERTGRI